MDHEIVTEPDWYPVDLDPENLELTWLHLPDERFLDPFFEDTIRRHRRTAPMRKTPVEVLRGANPDLPDPSAIFFHASRCGSTLLMQLFGRVDNCRALSEPPIVDVMLQLADTDDELLRGLLRSLAKTNRRTPGRLFLKLDSWHLPHLARIRRFLPQSPCFFLYRDPAAILRSHRRERGSQMVPGMIDSLRLGIDPASVNPADLDGYAKRVLGAIFRDAVRAMESGVVLPIAYSQLPEFVWEKLGPGLSLPEDGWDAAKERAKRDAKHAHRLHNKPAEPSDDEMIDAGLMRDFNRLEELRESLQQSWRAPSAC